MRPQDFLAEAHRMCKAFNLCSECPLLGHQCADCGETLIEDITAEEFAEMYDIVSEWSDAHKPETRQDKFLKKFPNADIDQLTGAISILPCRFDTKLCRERCDKYPDDCDKCAADYWGEEANEDEF